MELKNIPTIEDLRNVIKKSLSPEFLLDILALEYEDKLFLNWLKNKNYTHKYLSLKNIYSPEETDSHNLYVILEILEFTKEEIISIFGITDLELPKGINTKAPVKCVDISTIKSYFEIGNMKEDKKNQGEKFCIVCGMPQRKNDLFCIWCGKQKSN